MNRFLSHVWITAIHEFKDSIRSRWAVSLLLIYLAICMFMTYQFTGFLSKAESEVMKTLNVAEGAGAGSVTRRLWETKTYKNILMKTYEDEELVEHLLNVHPVVLIYAWFTVILGALLTLLMSSPRVAEELGTRSARFVLYRSDQLSWCIGKYWGQAMVLLPALLFSAVGVYFIASFRLAGFKPSMMLYLLEYGFMAYLYILAWLGLATCVSQFTRSQFLAVVYAIVGAFIFAIIEGFHEHFKWGGRTDLVGWRQVIDACYQMVPMSFRSHLWGPEFLRQLLGGVMLIALGHFYLMIGYFFTHKRDV